MRKLPNFICVGAQKAGTTTLHDILKQHPDIYLPELKEAHFFDQEEKYSKGIDWWLDTFFNTYKNEKIMGVITPEYLYYNEVPNRIIKDLGENIKIIIILRNPVERAYSHYLMSVRRGFENLSFSEAIKQEMKRIKEHEFNRNHFSYIDRGYYSDQIERYYKLFPKENILLLSFEEDIVKNIDKTIEKIELFLGIEELVLQTKLKSNSASKPRFKIINDMLHGENRYKKILKLFIKSHVFKVKLGNFIDSINQKKIKKEKLSNELKAQIFKNYYFDEINKLKKICNIDLSQWK